MVNWTKGADHLNPITYYTIEAKVANEPWTIVIPRLNESANIEIGKVAVLKYALIWKYVL